DAIIYEFYASLKDRENRRQRGEILTHVTVKGKEVLVMPREICRFYDTLFYVNDYPEGLDLLTFKYIGMNWIINFLRQGHSEWTRQANNDVPLKFNHAIMYPTAKMWMQFISTRLFPTQNASNVTAFRAIMLYFILQKNEICVGR
ncbi:hypothetical protein Goarm_014154, partial [Gossypium armourianum]|nr:hypothetical protein [Gossypium armourianum]